MRSIFVDHGNPMNAILENSFTQAICSVPIKNKPSRIAILSAHWLTNSPTIEVGSNLHPAMIYDMYGFPAPLYKVNYPVLGDPQYANIIHQKLNENNIPSILNETRGIDHGVWSVLVHLFPKADIPVIPISIGINKTAEFHFTLGKILNSILDNDTLIIGSGNITHNLSELDWNNQGSPTHWAHDFDSTIEIMIKNHKNSEIIDYKNLPGSRQSVPTPDHFYPFLSFLGSSENREISSYHKGFELGSLSTRIYFS